MRDPLSPIVTVRELAGSTGLEPDSECFSKLVMARDFWMQVSTHQWISSSDSVHSRLLASSDFDRDLGDILETTRHDGCQRRLEFLRVSDVILAFNVVLFLAAMSLLGMSPALYSILTYLAAAKTLDFVLYG